MELNSQAQELNRNIAESNPPHLRVFPGSEGDAIPGQRKSLAQGAAGKGKEINATIRHCV